jgi:protein O-GlcNAc transferase
MASPNALEMLKNAAAKFKDGQLDEAESVCRKILDRDVWNVAAMNLLSGILRKSQRLSEAVATMQRVVVMAPQAPEFRVNYGDLLLESQQPEEAEKQYREALALRPQYVKAWFQLGLALEQLKRKSEIEQCFQRVLQLDPRQRGALVRLAEIARGQGRNTDLLRYAEALLQIDPNDLMGRRYRASSLFNQGRFLEAIRDLRFVLEKCPQELELRGALLMSINYDPDLSAAAIRREHEESCRILFEQCVATANPPGLGPMVDRKMRIGYVSSDFKDHAVSRFFRPVVAEHDRNRFAIYLYFSEEKTDAVTEWYKTHCDGWRDIHELSTAQSVALVREDKIDILVDLLGFTGGSRLDVFACRPAPIQVTWLGYPSTTGLKTIDYLLSDNVVDPPTVPAEITEEVWRLPGAFCTFQPHSTNVDVGELPAVRNGFVTFGSAHGLAKLNDHVLDLWCAVLRSIPNSRLFVYRSALLPAAQPAFRDRFRKRGIADDRLSLAYKMPPSGNHLTIYHDMDLHLDCLPWNGHTTMCEALWMGVPTLTLVGDRHAGRMSASMLHAAGLDDFITHSPEEFVAAAMRLATPPNLPALAQLRQSLRDRLVNSRLMDAAAFTRELEAAYLDMWKIRSTQPHPSPPDSSP